MKIFNSLSSSKEEFISINKNKINLYVCGMTVYDDCHIGHARTFLTFDLFVRFFSYLGFNFNENLYYKICSSCHNGCCMNIADREVARMSSKMVERNSVKLNMTPVSQQTDIN